MSTFWRVTLSNGQIVSEGEAVPGEALPWRKLCEWSAQEGDHFTSLTLENGERTVSMPLDFERFNLGQFLLKPHSYAIQHRVEIDNLLGGPIGREFLDVIARYDDFDLHLISNLEGTESVLLITQGDEPMVCSPTAKL